MRVRALMVVVVLRLVENRNSKEGEVDVCKRKAVLI